MGAPNKTREYMIYMKALWQFCTYMFLPQRRPRDYYSLYYWQEKRDGRFEEDSGLCGV